eukprot:GCRY01002801.1.p1 GENE.GCRY01002801.1~~GCRY01002801.1.p1  ORF type:complete len:385 (-),score=113.53 GCRY01002801.1:28-1182(-)
MSENDTEWVCTRCHQELKIEDESKIKEDLEYFLQSGVLDEEEAKLFQESAKQPHQDFSNGEIQHVKNQLFFLMSKLTPTDQPLCEDCSDLLEQEIKKRIKEEENKAYAYSQYLEQAERQDNELCQESVEQLQAQEAQLVGEEEGVLAQIAAVEAELAAVRSQREKLATFTAQLNTLEESYWADYQATVHRDLAFCEERDSLQRKLDISSAQLERLRATNVLNEVFNIAYDGPFGTINGLRLGRTSSIPVDNAEINAAWGHVLLLLKTLANKKSFNFTGFKLVPNGSASYIIKYNHTTEEKLELVHREEGSWLSLGQRSSYKPAQLAILECIRQLGQKLRKAVRFQIKGDVIGDRTITSNSLDEWTLALKYMLIDLKEMFIEVVV